MSVCNIKLSPQAAPIYLHYCIFTYMDKDNSKIKAMQLYYMQEIQLENTVHLFDNF